MHFIVSFTPQCLLSHGRMLFLKAVASSFAQPVRELMLMLLHDAENTGCFYQPPPISTSLACTMYKLIKQRFSRRLLNFPRVASLVLWVLKGVSPVSTCTVTASTFAQASRDNITLFYIINFSLNICI